MTDLLEDLVSGFGQYLAGEIGTLAWPASAATVGQTGIYALAIPQAPDEVVALAPSIMSSDATRAMSVVDLQVRTRSAAQDPRTAWAVDNGISAMLLGNFPLLLPTGIRIQTLVRMSSGSLGQDDNLRWHWSTNYRMDVYDPSPHRG